MPAHATSGILHYVHRSMGRRKRIVEELAVARHHISSRIKERARHDDDACPRAFRGCGAPARGDVLLSSVLRLSGCCLGRALLGGITLVKRRRELLGTLRKSAMGPRQHHRKSCTGNDAQTQCVHETLPLPPVRHDRTAGAAPGRLSRQPVNWFKVGGRRSSDCLSQQKNR